MNNQNDDLKNLLNTEDTNTNAALLNLIQINDSAFPTGSYAHSFGMETYIQENALRNEDDLRDFCQMFLRYNLASTDAIIVKEAYDLAKQQDKQGLLHLEKICHGVKLAPEMRQASTMMGVEVDLDKMKSDTKRVRGDKPFVFADIKTQKGLDEIIAWIKSDLLLEGVLDESARKAN